MTAISSQSSARPLADAAVPMPRGRRRTEVLMLAFAIAVVLFAYANVGFGLNGKLPPGLVEYGLAFAVIIAVAHLAVRRFAPWADPLMLPQTEPVLFTGSAKTTLRPSIARKSCQNWYSAGVIPFARRYISAEARW